MPFFWALQPVNKIFPENYDFAATRDPYSYYAPDPISGVSMNPYSHCKPYLTSGV
jgi:hypothetical protein